MSESLGGILDALGVSHEPADGELISDAIVLLKVIDTDGSVALRMAFSDGMSWIERIGMLTVAESIERADCRDDLDD